MAPTTPTATTASTDRDRTTRERSPKIDLPTKRRRKHGRDRKPRRDNRKSRFDADFTADDERVNLALEAYYKAQRIVPQSEFEALFDAFRTPLPTSFRITADGSFRNDIESTLKGDMAKLFTNLQSTSKNISSTPNPDPVAPLKPPSPLSWYPGGLAWTVSAPRQMLRRDNVLAPFHRYLVRMHELGAINRQEAVSMVPPLLLDAHPGHSVIDMCAAPGSKTAQILETVSPHGRSLSEPGLVIANDADIKRCWMLAHQLGRFGSADLVVTHHEAQHFPKFMAFDRVLCDVPCTGDGTLRKAPDMWRRWNSDMGIGIHRLQRQILERGLDILKPGGRLVYSTCSMNPLENEAVVAHALRKYGDQIEIIDCSQMLPGLIRRKGLTTWKVKDNTNNGATVGLVNEERTTSAPQDTNTKEEKTNIAVAPHTGEDSEKLSPENMPKTTSHELEKEEDNSTQTSGWFDSFDDVPVRRRKKIVRSLFPPSQEELSSGNFPLEMCMRFVPHDQDTGAFFVTVIHKKVDAKMARKMQRISERQNEQDEVEAIDGHEDQPEKGSEMNDSQPTDQSAPVNGNKKVRRGTQRGSRLITDDPLVPVSAVSSKTLMSVSNFYGLPSNIAETCLLTRGSDGSTFRRIVAVSRSVRTVLRHALGTKEGGDIPESLRTLRVVNAGVRIMERTDRNHSECGFRLLYTGAHLLASVLSTRVVHDVEPITAAYLLGIGTYRIESTDDQTVIEEGDKIRIEEAKAKVKELWNNVSQFGGGSVVAKLKSESSVLVLWVGKRCMNIVMPQDVVIALLERLEKLCKIKVRNCKEKISASGTMTESGKDKKDVALVASKEQ